jgi:hypothetical protein
VTDDMPQRRSCGECERDGLWCGYGGDGGSDLPCLACGEPTALRSACGAPRHAHTSGIAAWPRARHNPQPEPDWIIGGRARRRSEALAAPGGRVQPQLLTDLATDNPQLTPHQLRRAVELWDDFMRGIEWRGGHRTAIAILGGTLKHHAIPAIDELDATATDLVTPLWRHRTWTVGPAPKGGDGLLELVGYDVNGQYLSAAAISLPTGDPDRIADPGDYDLSALAKYPGYIQLASLCDAPHGIQEQFVPGVWFTTPMVHYLDQYGAKMLAADGLLWRNHRRWLDPHVDLLRRARTLLMALLDGPDAEIVPVARGLLTLVKQIYTRMFGGLLASQSSPVLRPTWRDMIQATGQARMLRGADRALREGPVTLIGVYVDAVLFTVPVGYIPHLEISTQLGKFKPIGRIPWTKRLEMLANQREIEPLYRKLSE